MKVETQNGRMDLFELKIRWELYIWGLILDMFDLLILDLIVSFLLCLISFILQVKFHENVTVLQCNVL